MKRKLAAWRTVVEVLLKRKEWLNLQDKPSFERNLVRQTVIQLNHQSDSLTDRQTNRQTHRQAERQTDSKLARRPSIRWSMYPSLSQSVSQSKRTSYALQYRLQNVLTFLLLWRHKQQHHIKSFRVTQLIEDVPRQVFFSWWNTAIIRLIILFGAQNTLTIRFLSCRFNAITTLETNTQFTLKLAVTLWHNFLAECCDNAI